MRVLVTGSADGLGRLSAAALQAAGHDVVVHVRHSGRLGAVRDLAAAGAAVVTGDFADLDQVRDVGRQVAALGRMDAIIHNAGVYSGPDIATVNLLAPYVLTASLPRPDRLVFLSSGSHHHGKPVADRLDRLSYGDSKLLLTTFAMALARLWPQTLSNAVDPGWVPTRMGGAGAPDDLALGHLTQEWLATSDDPEARTSGRYWHHQRPREPHPAVTDRQFQDVLLERLAAHTGVPLPEA